MQKQAPARAFSQKELPPSVEAAYYRKCIELRRRITDIEENNDGTRQRITRLNRGIQKMRLERAFLLEQLQKHQEYNMDDSDRSSSPPPTPTDKPLRSKRSHRKGTPPAGGDGSAQHHSFGAGVLHHMSSAQSTPDPGQQRNPFFSSIGPAGSPPQAAVNGAHPPQQQQAPQPALPSLHAVAPIQTPQQQQQPRPTYFDTAYDEQRPTPAEHEGDAAAGRRRAYSGAQQPPSESTPQNGDTDMTDAGNFAGTNR